MKIVAIIYAISFVSFVLTLKFSSKPYPKEWEERENKALKKKFEEYEQSLKGQNK